MENKNELLEITSKYKTKCAACRKFVGVGWTVWWSKLGKYVVHTECKNKPLKKVKRKKAPQGRGMPERGRVRFVTGAM